MMRETILAIILISVSSYSIQGNWTLATARYIDIGNQSIILSISDYIFKGQSIFQKLIFSGCENMLLQAQFNDNQLFINGKSYYKQPIGNVSCSSNNNILNKIYSALNSVFFFGINIDTLIFNDAYGNSVMSFKRIINKVPANITGIWNMNQFGNTQTSLSVQISNTQITLCQGNLVLGYSLDSGRNLISLTPVISRCSSQDLTNAIQASKYFRLKNGLLNFYDSKVSLTAGLVYSSVFDPAKPIFGSQTSSTSSPQSSSPPSNLPISVSNLAGTWTIISLFSIPFPSTPYSLIFSATNIRVVGGCNNYTFNYTINSTTQIITLPSPSPSISNACSKSDDQLYVSGILKMNKYLLSNANGVFTLNFYDQAGNPGYSLRSAAPQTPQPQVPATRAPSTARTVPVAAPTSTATPLSPGTYLLLLLSRRDLPRLLVNVTSNTLSYKSCNNIQQTFTPATLTSNSGSISFSGGPTTSNSCTINNDQIYFGTLNLAKSYKFDPSAGALVLSNAAGAEIATLSNAS